ncbi:hypothetical protein PCL_08601 [Purpureocillium lilacinum]|uniref:Uncharacterized protein n=1 Tax=Purpureocillium lilacinum TaxID=33203 RepID=A0A2U3DR52_PURLI|nr:hypothetical protein PCL_08601 [Purpureocillium lilacinum]
MTAMGGLSILRISILRINTAELEAIAKALESIPSNLASRNVTVIPSNRSVVAAIRRPGRQSGQCTVRRIYDRVKHLQISGYSVRLMWEPANEDRQSLRALAKAAAQQATEQGGTGIATHQAKVYKAAAGTHTGATVRSTAGWCRKILKTPRQGAAGHTHPLAI